ncbi:hypothetical protein JS562_51720 [Agrobacterium sp. S2]|nr:hypothetical protein [Agrobacterium sp. S2]
MSTTSTGAPASAPVQPRNAIDRFFKISERGSTIGTEIRGGLVTFFTMSYIIVLNPLIIGTVQDGSGSFLGGGSEPNIGMIAATTALVAGVMSILMGVVANFPLALAAGLGLNAVVAYSIASLPDMTWGRRDGHRRARGPHHPGARAHRVPGRPCSGPCRWSSRRRSASASACSSPSSGWWTPGSSASRSARPRPSSSASPGRSAPGRCWSSSSACSSRSSSWPARSRAPSSSRSPPRPCSRSSSRPSGPSAGRARTTRAAGSSTSRSCPTASWPPRTSRCSASSHCSARSRRSAWSP